MALTKHISYCCYNVSDVSFSRRKHNLHHFLFLLANLKVYQKVQIHFKYLGVQSFNLQFILASIANYFSC